MNKKVVVIGAGIGGLGTAGLFAKKGYDVTVLEKNENFGGRANVFEAEGFRFDMGPSWYLAPDIFEHYFELLGEKINDLASAFVTPLQADDATITFDERFHGPFR